ncbi:MAG TPA: glycosyl hydrolase family 18 protein, partial [Desulfuromonadaceae bacterium]|nr:glycosyl hydrolase family 18 protein [Desulfuromonadaceae bacterium]
MKSSCLKILVLALLLVTGLTQAFAAFRVVGYMPSWQGSVTSIQYSKVTHINYAFLLPNSNGSLQAIDNASKLTNLVARAHNAGVKVSISVGGWNDGNDSAFVSLAGNSTYRTAFINNVSNFCNQYNLDGVDIDWEYPDTSSESSNYTTLMSQLSTAMHARGRTLTAAVIAYGSTGDYINSTVFSKVDWLNIMDYDNTSGVGQSTYSSAITALDYWNTTRGLPASKAQLGVPFYSDPSDYAFWDLLNRGADPYADSWGSEGYNGITTIQKKTNLAFDRGIGGIMFWELSQDATGQYSLLSAIDTIVDQRQTPTFGMSTTPSSRTVAITKPTTFTSTITPTNGFTGTVTFSVSGLPSGVTGSFSPTSVAGSGSSTLTLNVSSSATAGSYPLVIKGTSGSIVRSNNVTLVITDFTLALTPTSTSVTQGGSVDYTVTIGSVNGFNGAVLLQASSVPANSFASFNPGAVQAPGTSTLTITTTGSTPLGDSTVTVTGSSNVLAHSDSSILTVNSASGTLPGGWTDADIGTVGVGGSAAYDSSTGTFTVNGSGSDIWGTADSFNFASISTNGDVTVIARVATEEVTAAWAKCGVMIRESTAANAAYAGLYVTPSNGVSMQIRTATGATAVDLARQSGHAAPYWVKLVRSGSTFTGFSSADGSTWTQVGTTNITMAVNVLAGLADCAHDNTTLNTSTFDNVSVAAGSAPSLYFEAENLSYTTNG